MRPSLASFGSTGRLYAQINHGAPFGLFLAADSRRAELLEQQGRAVAGSRFTYAQGKLVLWSPNAAMVDAAGEVLKGDKATRVAIANPRTAPYGTCSGSRTASIAAPRQMRFASSPHPMGARCLLRDSAPPSGAA